MRAALAILVLALSASTPGCLACHDQLDIVRCREASGRCDPAGDLVVEWGDNLTGLWPDVARLLGDLGEGDHGHADWTRGETDAFWRFWQVPLDQPDKQVFLRHDGDLYHVRILEC